MSQLPEAVHRHIVAVEQEFQKLFQERQDDFLTEGVRYQLATGGKRLRPALCLMTCELLGGDPRLALSFALATEILHNFLLIHDDIEDGDTVRRDQQTLWARIGVPNALNVADYMIARAYRLMVEAELEDSIKSRLVKAFSFAFERTVEGQALDINLRAHDGIGLATYFRIVQLKTAYYLAVTWVGGAIVAGVAEDQLRPFWKLGECLGPAFQIRDDTIDLTEGKGRGGQIGCDILEGKPSIHFAYTLERKKGSDAERQRLVEIISRPREETSRSDVEWVIELYRREGALEFADREGARLVREADKVLDELPLDTRGRALFREVAEFIVGRKF